jgi:L-lactate dehydrogenase
VSTLISGDGAAPLSETPFSDDEQRMLRASADAIGAAVATLGI